MMEENVDCECRYCEYFKRIPQHPGLYICVFGCEGFSMVDLTDPDETCDEWERGA